MRLTLRTLLAYVDDTLPADQAREIGQKVAESHVAQELMERIKKVTRRRGLTVPPAAGPERIDANVVAEYLDNDLPADRVAEVEEMALNSDVHLAEIAACHQILTLVLGEPAHVPPTARERMYGLVQGKESEPNRRASRIGPPAFPGDAQSREERSAARRGVGYRLLGAIVLGLTLAVAVWQALPKRQPEIPPPPDNTVVENNRPPAPEPNPTPMPEPKQADANPMPPPPAPPVTPPVENKTPTPPVNPVPTPPKPDRSPSNEKKDIGQFVSRDAVLLARDGDNWVKVSQDAKPRTAGPLVALPGSHAELKFENGAGLTLWGGLPDTTGWKVLGCEATLHVPPAGFDLDFTLERGRVYVGTAKKMGPTKVRVRFADQIADVTLAEDGSEVMVEVVRTFAGEPFNREAKPVVPRTDVTLGVTQGKAAVVIDSKEVALQAPPGPAELRWPGEGKPIELDTPPAVWAMVPAKLSRERVQEIEAAQRKLVQRMAQKDKSIDVAVAEVSQDPSRAAKVLAALCWGTIGRLPPLVDDLGEPQFPELRQAAAAALAQFVARQPGNDQQVYDQLLPGYGKNQAATAVWLLRGFGDAQPADPAIYERLMAALRSEQIGVRELAVLRLRQADPEGAAQIKFNAADPEAAREKAVAEWQRRIPPGKLPPKSGPQGKAVQKAPSRG
jgi:hypothetical protein